AKGIQQLFRLSLELAEVRVLAEGASGQGLVHDELLSWLSVSARWPGVRSFGQKRDHQRVMNLALHRGDTVLSADTEAPQRARRILSAECSRCYSKIGPLICSSRLGY